MGSAGCRRGGLAIDCQRGVRRVNLNRTVPFGHSKNGPQQIGIGDGLTRSERKCLLVCWPAVHVVTQKLQCERCIGLAGVRYGEFSAPQ